MPASENGAGGDRRQAHAAVRTAGVAAASSAAVLAARHVLTRRSRGRHGVGDAVSAGLDAAWGSARDVLLPTLEETAAAAGRYVAEHAPEPIRDSLLPRFLDAFHEARERREGDDADTARDETKSTTGGGR